MLTVRRRQTTAPQGLGVLRLPGSAHKTNVHKNLSILIDTQADVHKGYVLSPYFQMKDLRKEAPGRDNNILEIMSYNVAFGGLGFDNPSCAAVMHFVDTSNDQDTFPIPIDLVAADLVDPKTFRANVITKTVAWAAGQGITLAGSSIMFPYDAAVIPHVVSNPTRALSTAYQPSTTSPTLVIMSVEQDDSLSLTGGTKSNVALLASSTSAFTTSNLDSEAVNGNTGTLTIGLNTIAAGGGVVVGVVPAGFWYKAVPTNTTGTATFTVLGTTEVSM